MHSHIIVSYQAVEQGVCFVEQLFSGISTATRNTSSADNVSS